MCKSFVVNKTNIKSGYVVLISVLIVGAIGLSITASLILLGIDSSKTTLSLGQSNQARAFSNSCAEEALQNIHDDVAFVGGATVAFSNGSCSYNIVNDGDENRTITTTGTVGLTVRRVKIIIDQISPSINVVSWKEVADF